MAGRYKQAGTIQERAAHKSRAQKIIPHLETTYTRYNTSLRRSTRPSAGPERSQLLRILPSLTVRQFFCVSAYFSCCANIGGHLIFSVSQYFCMRQCFSMRQGLWMRQCFCMGQGFWMRQMFLYAPRFLDVPMFLYAPRFLDGPMFLYAPRFWMRQCFCIYLPTPIFCVFCQHSYLVCANNLLAQIF